MVDEATSLKRCPRCETTKHKSEFSSMGYCRPCARDYTRERAAKKGGWAALKKQTTADADPKAATVKESLPVAPAPTKSKPAKTLKDVVDRVASPSSPKAAPRGTPSSPVPNIHRVDPTIGTASLQIARLCAGLVDLIDDGETVHLTATRVGAVIVLRGVDVERPR